MTVERRKIKIAQAILGDLDNVLLAKIEALIDSEYQQNEELKDKLTARAIKAEEDIKAESFLSRSDVEQELNQRLSL